MLTLLVASGTALTDGFREGSIPCTRDRQLCFSSVIEKQNITRNFKISISKGESLG